MTLKEVLTPRQYEIAELVHDGLNSEEMAERLGIAKNTVKHVIVAIYDRTGCENRVMLAMRFERDSKP